MKALLAIPALAVVAALATVLVLGNDDRAEAVGPPPTCSAPAPIAAPGDPPQPPTGGSIFGGITLSPPQISAAQTIVSTAKGLNITARGTTIALQAAMQESTLNPDAQNGNALGLFQQIQPGPYNAYVGYNPKGSPGPATRGFFTVLTKRAPGYDTDPRTNAELAELVEASGHGERYAKWEPLAKALVSALFDGAAGGPLKCEDQSLKGKIQVHIRGGNVVTLPPEAGVEGDVTAASPQIAKAIAAGLSWLGTPYAWGGGDANGPTRGIHDGGVADEHGDYNKVGFDCAGLTFYAYAQAGVTLTKPSRTQLTNAKVVVPFSQAQPGDLLFWGQHHVAMYLGVAAGRQVMLEAPQSGDVLKVSNVRLGGDFRNVATRPIPGGE